MKLTDQQRAELKARAIADRREAFTAYTVLDLLADIEEAEVEIRAERAAAVIRNGDIVQLRAERASARTQLEQCERDAERLRDALVLAKVQGSKKDRDQIIDAALSAKEKSNG